MGSSLECEFTGGCKNSDYHHSEAHGAYCYRCLLHVYSISPSVEVLALSTVRWFVRPLSMSFRIPPGLWLSFPAHGILWLPSGTIFFILSSWILHPFVGFAVLAWRNRNRWLAWRWRCKSAALRCSTTAAILRALLALVFALVLLLRLLRHPPRLPTKTPAIPSAVFQLASLQP